MGGSEDELDGAKAPPSGGIAPSQHQLDLAYY